MNERKIQLFIVSVIAYCMYSVHMWFMKENGGTNTETIPESIETPKDIHLDVILKNITTDAERNVKPKIIPLFIKDACSILQIFTEKPTGTKNSEKKKEDMDANSNTITMIGITVFLVILTLNAVLDVLKVREEEKIRRKLNPDGERRQSLAEFANKKSLRRESSKFGLQLFQIAESVVSNDEDRKTRRQTRPYTRGDSTNSYLSDRKTNPKGDGSAPASISDSTMGESKLVKRQSVAKLFGARPVPMVRRSSFPALPLNPEVQALMLGHRQSSFDSDDEDGKGRRVRIIRRY
ncbi:unnamed protein product [Diatraea saccharalis]|uniref:Uncharacterized protein n=1 Tax=Diatraea saccharalis TaxID=40085 RepID=A0A9P0BZL5_9NEOP|nr:unnamed protein product [Diatraea saccharalis]